MKARNVIQVLFALMLAPGFAEDEFRVFTSTQGQTFEGRIVNTGNDEVTIERRDKRLFTVPVSRFSPGDQAYIADWKPAAPEPAPAGSDVPPDAINGALGHALFADGHLWDDVPETVAERLDWPRESKTKFLSSFRRYPEEVFRFLGARPYSAALYGNDDLVSGVSLVFANKGDSFGDVGAADDPVKALNEAIARDVEAITTALSRVLGEPVKQRFGEGSSRQSMERWNWNRHAFLLSHQESEYVSLGIYPKEFADGGGRMDRVREVDIRSRCRSNVEQRENGDVVIANLPMVDQGPKGYCAPATFERCMRYMGIQADMYLLAMAGKTGIGGGTYTSELAAAIGNDIRRKGRTLEGAGNGLDLRKLSRYIDEGIPVIWGMFCTDAFRERAEARTAERKEVKDWATYRAKVAAEAKESPLKASRDSGHITLIMGYNAATNEVAISHSWGERFLEQWIAVPDAEAVSQGEFQVVTF